MWRNMKFLHMWSNYKFCDMKDVEKSESSPHLACMWCGECLHMCKIHVFVVKLVLSLFTHFCPKSFLSRFTRFGVEKKITKICVCYRYGLHYYNFYCHRWYIILSYSQNIVFISKKEDHFVGDIPEYLKSYRQVNFKANLELCSWSRVLPPLILIRTKGFFHAYLFWKVCGKEIIWMVGKILVKGVGRWTGCDICRQTQTDQLPTV